MSSFFKGIALFVAITCAVWIAVLWRWEATSRDMNTPDIVVYLGLLPLTVFGLALLLRWAWRGAAARQTAAAAAAAVAASANAGPAVPAAMSNDESRRHSTVQLLAAHLLCAAGATPSELLAAAKEGKPRPALDPELRDDDGLPVFTARLPDLDLESVEPLLGSRLDAVRAQRAEWSAAELPEHRLRALAALQPVLLEAARSLLPWHKRFEVEPPAGLSERPDRTERTERKVRVLLGWPADWSEFDQEVGRAFATGVLATISTDELPAQTFVLTTLAGSGEALILQADRLLQTLARDGRDDPVLVAACHSAIGADAVAALDRQGQLFSSARSPRGRMPAEAAAALVLAAADWPAAPGGDGAPPSHLHRPALVVRDKPVDAPGRIDPATAVLAMEQALATSQQVAGGIGGLVSDADQHTARSAELHGGALAVLPHLDASEDLRLLGTVTGAVDAVGALLVLACAAAQAQAADAPCLALACGDPLARLSLVALPGPPKAAAAPGPSPGTPGPIA